MKEIKEWIYDEEQVLDGISEEIESLQKRWFLTSKSKELLENLKKLYVEKEIHIQKIKNIFKDFKPYSGSRGELNNSKDKLKS